MSTEYKFAPKEILSRFKQGFQSYKAQRKRENEALRFMVPEYQWTDQAKAMRNGGAGFGGAAVPARPCLSISKIDQPIQLVQNQFQNANLGVNIHPLSEKANKETAEILQGLYRKIERDSNAVLPRAWAFDRAVEAGTGVYRIVTEYDDETEDDQFDQKILIKRILRQDAVIFDPSAQEPDYSDANWAFVASWMSMEDFKRQFPKADLASAEQSEIDGLVKDRPDWVNLDGENVGILVAEYFCKHYYPVLVEGVGPDGEKVTRTKNEVRLMWSKICAGTKDELQELESEEWNGMYIPLIPVIGKEMQVFDKERRYTGIVEPAMDSQRGYNYAITTAIEIAALEPKAPVIGAEGQFEGHEDKWNQANIRNWPYLEYKPTELNGQLLPPPQRMQIDASRLSVSLQLAQQFDQAIQATTYTPDPALGKNSRDESGKAIIALQSQSQASTSNFMANMAQISMTYEAKVILDMIPRIYDRPGRIARILDFQDEPQEVILNQPFVNDPASGRPRPVPLQPEGMSTSGMMPNQAQAPKPKVYNLTEGKYGVSVSIGKSYASRMEQGKETLLALFEVSPETVPILLPTFMKFSDEPWAQEAGKLMKNFRDQKFPELDKPEPGEETPEQLRTQLEALKAQLQQAEQIMQQMKQAIETKQVEQQGKIEAERVKAEASMAVNAQDAETQAELERIKAESDAALVQIKADADAALQAQEQEFEMQRLRFEQAFEAMQAELDRRQAKELAVHQAEVAEANADREDMRAAQEKEGEE